MPVDTSLVFIRSRSHTQVVQDDYQQKCADIGAFWFHDGNPRRPYARLSAGGISNGFFNCGILAEHAGLFHQACKALIESRGLQDLPKRYNRPIYIVGGVHGATPVVKKLAELMGVKAALADKQPDGTFVFKDVAFEPNALFILCDDTITQGTTAGKVEQAVLDVCPTATFFPSVLAICNRSKQLVLGGRLILALIHRPMHVWTDGHNPFTPDGMELVPPLRPKGDNWPILTGPYA